MKRTMRCWGLVTVLAFSIGVLCIGRAGAQESQQPVTPQNEKKLAQGEKEAKKMLLLMDKDKNGKVSRQEFMNFMEAEFQRLDINHDGELDVQELTDSHVRVRTRGR
jgi:Ca2+-binding EF-hand superfamily protein